MAEKEYKYMQNEEFGRSMIEIIGVLAISALLTGGAFVLIRGAMANQKRSRAIDEVAAIVENVRGLYAGRDDFSSLTNDMAYGTRLVDGFYLNTVTPFGADTRYSVVRNPDDNNTFLVLLTNLKSDDCTDLAEQTWPDAMLASCDQMGSSIGVYLTFGK